MNQTNDDVSFMEKLHQKFPNRSVLIVNAVLVTCLLVGSAIAGLVNLVVR